MGFNIDWYGDFTRRARVTAFGLDPHLYDGAMQHGTHKIERIGAGYVTYVAPGTDTTVHHASMYLHDVQQPVMYARLKHKFNTRDVQSLAELEAMLLPIPITELPVAALIGIYLRHARGAVSGKFAGFEYLANEHNEADWLRLFNWTHDFETLMQEVERRYLDHQIELMRAIVHFDTIRERTHEPVCPTCGHDVRTYVPHGSEKTTSLYSTHADSALRLMLELEEKQESSLYYTDVGVASFIRHHLTTKQRRRLKTEQIRVRYMEHRATN